LLDCLNVLMRAHSSNVAEMSGEPPLLPKATHPRIVGLIESWLEATVDERATYGLVAWGKDETREIGEPLRYFLRLRGEERAFITCWLTLDQRTLRYETQFMPAPVENQEELYRYLLSLNASLYALSFSIGSEEAIYLTGRIPLISLNEDELDRVLGGTLRLVEDHFPTAMAIGYASQYRRNVSGGQPLR